MKKFLQLASRNPRRTERKHNPHFALSPPLRSSHREVNLSLKKIEQKRIFYDPTLWKKQQVTLELQETK